MKFRIAEIIIGGKSLEIDEARFMSVRASIHKLRALFEFEMLFSVIALSFREFEEFLIQTSLDEAIDYQFLERRLGELQSKCNLRLIAFLNSVRAYHDQRPHFVSPDVFSDPISRRSEEVFSRLYDAHFEYRLMEGIRNYSQHKRPPIEIITIGKKSEYLQNNYEGQRRLRHTTEALLSTEKLSDKHAGIKPKLREELRKLSVESLDARFLVRRYMALVFKGHQKIRELTAEDYDSARAVIEGVESDFKDYTGKRSTRVLLTLLSPEVEVKEGLYLGVEYLSEYDDSRRRYMPLGQADTIYVSSQLTKGGRNSWPIDDQEVWIAD